MVPRCYMGMHVSVEGSRVHFLRWFSPAIWRMHLKFQVSWLTPSKCPDPLKAADPLQKKPQGVPTEPPEPTGRPARAALTAREARSFARQRRPWRPGASRRPPENRAVRRFYPRNGGAGRCVRCPPKKGDPENRTVAARSARGLSCFAGLNHCKSMLKGGREWVGWGVVDRGLFC